MKQIDQSLQHEVLDPCLLGRPVHLLPGFTAQLREDFAQAFRTGANRRYWASFQVDEVTVARTEGIKGAERWISFASSTGTISFSIERGVLLSVLNYRYGRRGETPSLVAEAPDAANLPVRITATEERLAVTLGQQLAGMLAARIETNLAESAETPGGSKPQAAPMKAAAGLAPAKGSWVVGIAVRNLSTGEQGQLWFGLDHALMASVLRGLANTRDKSKTSFQNTAALASRLQVKLTGRLVNQQVFLGELLDIRVGDVIPVNMGRADVLLEESCLFTAAITEHKGKLCLTSFEDAE
ncbi:FliM/FliN family flagellar motor switch protein [Undibacterium terreum]|uniref:Flagellar motor switch protein FliN-like C-terminal domain-containing protein n=1 Tax=Undibacterium terreum TaxID=1224302 RepID=A0A916XIP6_9BURK|nr:FliM/FliN family flagellar motor switch protein [Undibacterium terreum]GGC74447.1 hypothetical protein GCM10011396_22110 [Undibacterium terreum]